MLIAAILLIILGGLGLGWSIWIACIKTSTIEGGAFTGFCGLIWLATTCSFAQILIQKI